jgi:hypothetical protein
MANRYVRIYDDPISFDELSATILGFSMSAGSIAQDAGKEWDDFFGDREYTVRQMTRDKDLDREAIRVLGSPSFVHYEVIPPMSDKHIRELGSLCARHIDVGHNGGYLIDNRRTEPPLIPFDRRGSVITAW